MKRALRLGSLCVNVRGNGRLLRDTVLETQAPTGSALRWSERPSSSSPSVSSLNTASKTQVSPSSRLVDEDVSLFSKEFSEIERMKKDVQKLKPALQPSFTLAAYVNQSTLLQNLIKVGVDLTKFEKGNLPNKLLKLDFDRDVKPILFHLHGLGVKDELLGSILSK
jgi:hypothetical protein